MGEYSTLVKMFMIATDFDNFKEDHELEIPMLNLLTLDTIIERLQSIKSSEVIDLWIHKLVEYKGLSKDLI